MAVQNTRINDFLALLELIFKLANSLAGRDIPLGRPQLLDAERLSTKFTSHMLSIRFLYDGTSARVPNHPNLSFYDNGSINLILRAAIESYLVLNFIFGQDSKTHEEFWHVAWQIGGLADRQKFHISLEESKAVFAADKIKLAELRNSIDSLPLPEPFTPKELLRIRNGE